MRSFCRRSLTVRTNPRQSRGLTSESGRRTYRGFTLVEMLVAMAITLVMMAAVVTLFANVTNGVRNRRATLELSSQMRQVRNTLQQDLQGATCPGQTWQKPESNHGYIEYIEGPYRDGNATNLVDGDPTNTSTTNLPPTETNPEIDHQTSTLPSSNLPLKDPGWATDGSGLGDYDDILMLTVRNESKPFVGRAPANVRLRATTAEEFNVDTSTAGWDSENIESQLAEVVWFSIENPGYTDDVLTDPTAGNFFGEPGYRTVYRRTLLIAPWVNPYRYVNPGNGTVTDTFQYNGQDFKAEPGLVRMLPSNIQLEDAIAALIAFQDRYDLSVRLEWDASLSRFKIMANTLGDLTKRENRFCHYGYTVGSGGPSSGRRIFPYPMASWGGGYSGSTADVEFVPDPEVGKTGPAAKATAHIASVAGAPPAVVAYSIDAPADYTDPTRRYKVRPFAFVNKSANVPATAQAMLNDEGGVVRVVHGPVPLWGERHGEDVQLTNVLSFDVRAFDPGAPIFRHLERSANGTISNETTLTPNDPGWKTAYESNDNMNGNVSQIGRNNADTSNVVYPFVGQGAYVNLGYGYDVRSYPNIAFNTTSPSDFSSSAQPWFYAARALSDVFGNQLAPGYSVYDTWSFHYENNGVNEDADEINGSTGAWQLLDGDPPADEDDLPQIDEGTNGIDDYGHYSDGTFRRLGVDDIGERETVPPYDKPLRGAQVIMRAYERDSRVIRQMRVNQHFMPE
jgi:prepilin-type N-terminal cleavage/methylation domain-containing protein